MLPCAVIRQCPLAWARVPMPSPSMLACPPQVLRIFDFVPWMLVFGPGPGGDLYVSVDNRFEDPPYYDNTGGVLRICLRADGEADMPAAGNHVCQRGFCPLQGSLADMRMQRLSTR
jgi:hypothetical protein